MTRLPIAYRVPFRLERESPRATFRLVNTSREIVRGVSFTLHGSGIMAVSAPVVVHPGGDVEMRIAAKQIAHSTILVVRWFRPNGTEYLWRISF